MADGPLITLLIRYFLRFLGYICSIIALPVTLYGLLVRSICNFSENIDTSFSHFLLWLPRWLIVTCWFPFFLAECALIGYGIHKGGGSISGSVVIPIALFITTIIGLVWTSINEFLRNFFPLPKMIGKGGYFSTLWQAQIDLLAFFATLVTIFCVIRIPFLIWSLVSPLARHNRSIRRQLFTQFLMTFFDLFISLPFGLLMIFFPWRWTALAFYWEKSTRNYTPHLVNYALTPRMHIFKEFLFGLFDVMVAPLVIFLVLTPWRFVILYRKITTLTPITQSTINKKRSLFLLQVGNSIVDLLCMFLGLFVVLTLYRLIPMIKGVWNRRGENQKREVPCYQCMYVFFDLLTVTIALPFVLITVYRVPTLIRKCRIEHFDMGFTYSAPHYYHSSPTVQYITFVQFFKFLRDIPFIVMGFFVTVLLWRAFFMWRDILSKPRNRDKRYAVASHFGYLFIDVIDLPFVFASLLIVCTLWRAYVFYQGLKILGSTESARSKSRVYVLKQFGFWLLDIPTSIGALILLLSVYRAKNLIHGVGQVWFSKSTPANVANADLENVRSSAEMEDNPVPSTPSITIPTTWHQVVGLQFGLLLLDLPFPILLVLTLWRLPMCVRRLKTECTTAMERRVTIIRHLWWVCKDIPCGVLLVIIICLGWRIPTLRKEIKNYQRGDDEHAKVVSLFFNMIIDIPFVIMGLATIIMPFRTVFLIRSLIIEEQYDTDWKKRILAFHYFLATFSDVFVLLIGSIICLTVWRIPSYVAFLKFNLNSKIKQYNEKFCHTLAVLEGTVRCLWVWFLDVISFIHLIVIFCCLIHIIPLIQRMISVYKKRGMKLPSNVSDDYDECYSCMCREEEDELKIFPISLSYFRPLIKIKFIDTIQILPHVALLPLKIAGVIFLPLHLYISYRLGATDWFRKFREMWVQKKEEFAKAFRRQLDNFQENNTTNSTIDNNNNNPNNTNNNNNNNANPIAIEFRPSLVETGFYKHPSDSPFVSFLQYPLIWLHSICMPRMSFWGLDQLFILNVACFVIVLPNEIALFLMLLNGLVISAITLFSPLWRDKAQYAGWTQLGNAQGLWVILESLLLIFQTTLFPVFLFIQLIILFLPMLVLSAGLNPSYSFSSTWPSFGDFWKGFFTTKQYWKGYKAFPWYFWVLMIYWIVIVFATWHITTRVCKRKIPHFNPIRSYYWLGKKIIAGRIWGAYRYLLEASTRFCYIHRRTCCCLGELLMFIIPLTWSCWPLLIPILTKIYYLFLPFGLATLFLIWRAKPIITSQWHDPNRPKEEAKPELLLRQLFVEIPETGGIIFKFVAFKQPNFVLTQARLSLEGEIFWQTLGDVFGSRIISAFKMTMYPPTLCPSLMDQNDFQIGTEDVTFFIRIGVGEPPKNGNKGSKPIKRSTIVKKINNLVQAGDPPFKLIIEHGVSKFGWTKKGVLLIIDTLRFSDILTSDASKQSVINPNLEILSPRIEQMRIEDVSLDTRKNNNNNNNTNNPNNTTLNSDTLFIPPTNTLDPFFTNFNEINNRSTNSESPHSSLSPRPLSSAWGRTSTSNDPVRSSTLIVNMLPETENQHSTNTFNPTDLVIDANDLSNSVSNKIRFSLPSQIESPSSSPLPTLMMNRPPPSNPSFQQIEDNNVRNLSIATGITDELAIRRALQENGNNLDLAASQLLRNI